MRIVLDTNCLIVCLPANSPYYCIWKAFREMRITLCYTTDIINEYSEILPSFYSHKFVNDVINELLLSLNVVRTNNYFRWDLITADLDDNKFVDCTLNAGANYLVTNDRHFNVLKSLVFPPIRVVDIEAFRNILMV